MKIGDRVRIVVPDYQNHRVGDDGVITDHYWSDADVSCFGVSLDDHENPNIEVVGVDQGWAYTTEEIEVI